MPTQSAYEQLIQAQADAKAKLDAAQAKYDSVNPANDAGYVYNKSRIGTINAAADSNGGTALKTGSGHNAKYYDRYQVWIDSNEVMWYDGTTPNLNAAARAAVSKKDGDVKKYADDLLNATNTYNNAKKSVTDYEKNSPVGSAIASATAAAAKSQTVKNVLYILGTLVGIGLLISLVRWYEKNNSKKSAAV